MDCKSKKKSCLNRVNLEASGQHQARRSPAVLGSISGIRSAGRGVLFCNKEHPVFMWVLAFRKRLKFIGMKGVTANETNK